MNGIIPLWKEKGMTSHDAVFKLRKILHTKKIGHTGTLDPEVEGVLPICVGRATKLAEYMTDEGKEYIAEVMIGKSTTTEDATGEIIAEKCLTRPITENELKTILAQLTGKITQIPPMFSAVKVNGRKLYEYARRGEVVERPKREVFIEAIELLWAEFPLTKENPSFIIRIRCGKGTYIRTLAVMIGELLGYPAHMVKLERTKSGYFTKKDCYTLADIQEKTEAANFSFLAPIEKGVASFKKVIIGKEICQKALNGMRLSSESLAIAGEERIALFYQNKLVALYKPHPERVGYYKPEKVIMLREGPLH